MIATSCPRSEAHLILRYSGFGFVCHDLGFGLVCHDMGLGLSELQQSSVSRAVSLSSPNTASDANQET